MGKKKEIHTHTQHRKNKKKKRASSEKTIESAILVVDRHFPKRKKDFFTRKSILVPSFFTPTRVFAPHKTLPTTTTKSDDGKRDDGKHNRGNIRCQFE